MTVREHGDDEGPDAATGREHGDDEGPDAATRREHGDEEATDAATGREHGAEEATDAATDREHDDEEAPEPATGSEHNDDDAPEAATTVRDHADEERLLQDYQALNDPGQRRQLERRGSFFVVEGRLALEALLGSPYPLRSVVVTEAKARAVTDLVGDRGPVVVRPAANLAAITGYAFHRGVLASADRLRPPLLRDLVAHARTVAVLEGINDHENLGALFRNAAAFGVDAVLLDPTTADPLYRRSVRVSLGHVLRVPWTRLDRLPGGLEALRVQGFGLVALTPVALGESIDDFAEEIAARAAASSRPLRLALIFGAEGPGLSAGTLAAADRRVRIPIAPGVDSLNVSAAAAIAFHRLVVRV